MDSIVEQSRISQNSSLMSSYVSAAPPVNNKSRYSSSIAHSANSINEPDGPTFQVSPVYKASYSNINVIEMEVNGCPVMRRLKDSFFNVTQILKVAGLDRSQRSKLLESEVYTGRHEKVQGGSGKYQGTWIPYEKTVELCRRYNVYEVMTPLLLYNVNTNDSNTPTRDQLIRSFSTLTEPDERKDNNLVYSSNGNLNNGNSTSMSTPATRQNTLRDHEDDDEQPTPKRPKLDISPLPPLEIFDHETKISNPSAPYTMRPLRESESEFDEKSKVVMSSLFLPTQQDLSLLELVGNDESQLEGICIDAPIDDNGQTALHLAATLGRLNLVKDLVRRGANRIRGDNDGQTALIRAVHATNCFEFSCFDNLLDYLYPAITVLDHKGRTVLHHIAYTCGRKGRNDACKYYLETLLEWLVKRGPTLPPNQALDLKKFMHDVVNIPDRNGDTCLNVAAMVGNKHIIQQLLDVGADPNRPNKAGVKPTDCGVNIESSSNRIISSNTLIKSSDSDNVNNSGIVGSSSDGLFPEKQSSLKILDSIQTFVSQLGKDFHDEMEQKTKQISSMHPKLREKTLKLSGKRKQYDELQKIVRKLSDYKTKIINLNKAIEEEEIKFQEQTKELPVSSANFAGDFDADEPFTVWSVYNEIESKVEQILNQKQQEAEKASSTNGINNNAYKNQTPELDTVEIINSLKAEDLLPTLSKTQQQQMLPPSVVLEARIDAYKKNNEMLIERTKSRRSSSQELEQQFKRVIALCIGSKPEDIDEKLLGNLLLSVENDPDPEINQIKKVLKIVNDLDK